MPVYHDEIEIEDFEYDEDTEAYYYPCPCGDRFVITLVSRVLKTVSFLVCPKLNLQYM